ncbi:polysaccharide deacetylase [Sphingomonas bacterium]|uniref:polysaccharide deacetylase n=1 Tax=Sphingomonas bacterium TaxID=1895847 RepID=UPI0020C6A5B6|nr:polysaccharide deacetylase [Sphingomonas bacterium]
MTPVFLTIDAEFAWRHHVAGRALDDLYRLSCEPAGVGVAYQLARLAAHRLKACFFIDPMPAIAFGLEPIRRLVGQVLDAGQEVQLHCHPNWAGARAGDRGARHARFEMVEYSAAEQHDLIAGAAELLVAAGAPQPVAFRGGSYSADDRTLTALAALGIAYDSSHNGAEAPWPSGIGLPPHQIAPVARGGVTEVPVTLVEERPGRYRPAQICALSTGELRAVLTHAVVNGHACATLVSHGFELANRAGTRANAVHVRRFDALCEALDEWRHVLSTVHFGDAPRLTLGRDDRPLAPGRLMTGWRQAEQLWSNMIEERAA